MPSALADALFQSLIDAFPPHTAYAADAFERAPMPPPVAHFLGRLLQRRLHHEVSSLDLPWSSWFDTEHTAVQQARQALAEALLAHGQFPPESWEASLQQASDQIAAYLVQPTATLVAFVFQEGDQAAAVEIIDRRLAYFSSYRYLPDTVRLYLEQKGVPELSRARFADLLRQIDRQMTSDFDADKWLKMMKPLFALARHAHPEVAGIPVDVLQAFFEDKDAEVYVQRLHTAHEQGTTQLDQEGLRTLLEGPAAPAPPPEPEPPAARPTPPPVQPEPANGPVPLWKQFRQQETQPPLAEQVATSIRRDTSTRRPPPAKKAEPRWKQFRNENSAPESAASAPSPSPPQAAVAPASSSDLAMVEQAVLGSAGARNRDLFIRHLFNEDRTDYERVLGYLDAASTWTDASKIIASEVFRKNQVNIYSDPAVLFTDAVETRYGA